MGVHMEFILGWQQMAIPDIMIPFDVDSLWIASQRASRVWAT
jgi:hypothetical protein